MTTSVHSTLTGSDLHESKGVATALAGEVYVTDGAGSGVWTPASSVITNTAFTTGDTKTTLKTSPDASWIFWATGTIGDGSSGASIRANADTSALFLLLWNGYANTICAVSSGRGISAAADYAAHKTIALPPGDGIVSGVAGNSQVPGVTIGSATATLITTNLPPYTPAGAVGVTSSLTGVPLIVFSSGGSNTPGGGGNQTISGGIAATFGGSFAGTAQGGTSTPFSIVQPSVFYNTMIKL